MKRKFLGQHSANALLKGRSLLAGAAVLFLALILLILRLTVPQFLITITSPIVQAGNGFTSGAHTLFEAFGSKVALVRERDALQSQVDILTANERTLAGQLRDMERLLGGRHTATPGILGSVRMRPPVSPYDTLVIDVGSVDGVSQGALVSGEGGIPLGTINHLTEKTARVSLFSTPGRETEAWVGANHTPQPFQKKQKSPKEIW
jgi:cell shape-determining protein MreC